MTEIRLAEFNGLHLVIYGKSVRPDMAALVLSSQPDAGLQVDTEALGATTMIKPVASRQVRAAVLRSISRLAIPGRPADPIWPPFERRERERRAAGGPSVAAVFVPGRADRRRDYPAILDAIRSNGARRLARPYKSVRPPRKSKCTS